VRMPDGSSVPDRMGWLPPASVDYEPIHPLPQTQSKTTVTAGASVVSHKRTMRRKEWL
jgi:hypothetical protein